MAARLAVGVGCRKAVSAEAVTAQVAAALAPLSGPVVGLFTIAAKADEPGLRGAALALGLPLVALEPAALAAVAAKLTVRSARVEARFGVPSVAEAAALAAFAGQARLIVPRRAAAGVTVAIAEELPT